MGLDALVANITDSVGGLLNDLGFDGFGNKADGSPAYPKDAAYKKFQNSLEDKTAFRKLNFPYTFAVVDIFNPGSKSTVFGDFELPLAPQTIKQTEPFAISIKPTQGGTVTTHSGNRYKDLIIQGTTGIAPFRGGGGVNRATGEGIFQPKKLKFKSGYEVFHHLRNWFRTYYEYKSQNKTLAEDLRLIWRNYKDGEFLIVELKSFETSRNAQNPFGYDYNLTFRVIAPFDFRSPDEATGIFADIDALVEDAKNKLDFARGVILRTQEILRQVESTYESIVIEPLRKIALIISALKSLPLVAADIGSNAINKTMRATDTIAVLTGLKDKQKDAKRGGDQDPRIVNAKLPADIESAVASTGTQNINSLGETLMAIDLAEFPAQTQDAVLAEQTALANSPRAFFEDILTELTRVKANAEDLFNVGSETYDALFDRTATLNADDAKVITDAEFDLLAAFSQAKSGISNLLATDILFKSDFDTRIQLAVDQFGQNISLQANTSVLKIILGAGDTLERLAAQYLNDSHRWGEIVEANNLKPPFITDDFTSTASGVLKIGDDILIPVPPTSTFSQVPKGPETNLIKDLDEVERSFGVDFKFDSNFDLILSNLNDFELVSGTDNVSQAIVLKLAYTPGDVIRHPMIGAGVIPGIKTPVVDIVKDDVIRSLLQDPRIERIDSITVELRNSTITLDLLLALKSVDIPVPIKILI